MSDDILKRAREIVEDVLTNNKLRVISTQDAIMIYLLLKMEQRLESIDEKLEQLLSNSNDMWNERHNL